MNRRISSAILLLLIVALLLPPDAEAQGFNDLPAGFADELVVGGVGLPTAIAWLPPSDGGDLLITSQEGTLHRWDGSGPADALLDLSSTICSGGETGLLGVAVDPDFDDNGFIYLYYTNRQDDGSPCSPSNRANRVSRFALAGNTVGNETPLLDNIAAPGGNHNAGDLHFAKDGFLYVSVGDGGKDLRTGQSQDGNGNARRLDLLNGKILRITRDGAAAPGNPFNGQKSVSCALSGRVPEGSAATRVGVEKKQNKKARKRRRHKKRRHRPSPVACREIFATGLRNPFRFAFDPDDNNGAQRFFINDVGGGAWEEIDAGAAGADYGWNIREGPCRVGSTSQCDPDNRFVEPVFAYDHNAGCRTITGGAFVPDDTAWPDEYTGVYFYADFSCDKLFALRNEAPGETPETFGSGVAATHLAFGPDGALYYATFAGGGQVRKIVPPSP